MNRLNLSAIRPLCRCEINQAATVLSHGMCRNPANVRAFGAADPERRRRALEQFFLPVLRGLYDRGVILGAFCENTLVGVCGMARPGCCQPPMREKLLVFPAVAFRTPLDAPLRIFRWSRAWARHDPSEAHWHLGPVAVAPHLQGKGIGGAMLAEFCARMDACCMLSYLETDKPENIAFYQKFGFAVIGQAQVLGVPNWFMSRQVGV